MRIFLMALGAGLLIVLALLARFSFVTAPGVEGTIVDSKGNPLEGCFIVYDYYLGGGFDRRPGSVIETDSKGYFRIRPKVMRKFALWDIDPKAWVWSIYSPKTHGTTAMWPLRAFLEGVVDARPKEKKIIFYDLSESPADWFAALDDMQKILDRMPPQYHRGWDIALEDCQVEKSKLFNACSNDVALFRSRYYRTPYQSPKYVKPADDYRAAYRKTFGAWTEEFEYRHRD